MGYLLELNELFLLEDLSLGTNLLPSLFDMFEG
jgi:hypothetical protein